MASPASPAAVPLRRYVELIRVSGAQQSARDTPADQRAALDALRLSRPGTLVERIEEGAAGLSGALPLAARPDLLRLFELARARAFDEVRVRHLNRLTRHPDLRERAAIYGAIKDAGAVIVDAGGGIIDTSDEWSEVIFILGTKAAAMDRKNILKQTAEARLRKAKQGEIQGRPPYARIWDKKSKAWGTKEPELTTYRRLFKNYLAGKSCQKIAADLNTEGVPPPGVWWKSGRRFTWSSGSVFTLLSHRSAVGEVTSCGQKIACPPIVDAPTFEKVQARLKVKNWRAGHPPATDLYAMLRGLMSCGECGSRVWVVRGGCKGRYVTYYRCGTYQSTKQAACRKCHAVERIDHEAQALLTTWLDRHLIRAKDNRLVESDAAAEAKQAKRELAALEKREENLARLLTKGLVSAGVGERQLGEIQRERREVSARLQQSELRQRQSAEESAAVKAEKRELLALRSEVTGTAHVPPTSWRRLAELVSARGDGFVLAADGKLKLGGRP